MLFKILLIASVALVKAQIQMFPSFPTNPVSTQAPSNNFSQWQSTSNSTSQIDLIWPQQTTTSRTSLLPVNPTTNQNFIPIWPQPTQAPPRPPLFVPPRPSPPNSNNPPTPTPRPSSPWRPGVFDRRCPIPDGDFPVFFSDPTNCRNFFMCSGGIAWTMKCPSSVTGNVIWNQAANVCEEVEETRC